MEFDKDLPVSPENRLQICDQDDSFDNSETLIKLPTRNYQSPEKLIPRLNSALSEFLCQDQIISDNINRVSDEVFPTWSRTLESHKEKLLANYQKTYRKTLTLDTIIDQSMVSLENMKKHL